MKMIILAAMLFAGLQTQAQTLGVEFLGCSYNENYLCALVYDQGPGREMPVRASDEILESIEHSIIPAIGRSLALSIDGKVLTINGITGDTTYALVVYSMSTEDTSKPR